MAQQGFWGRLGTGVAQNWPVFSTVLGAAGSAIAPRGSWQQQLGNVGVKLAEGPLYQHGLNSTLNNYQPNQGQGKTSGEGILGNPELPKSPMEATSADPSWTPEKEKLYRKNEKDLTGWVAGLEAAGGVAPNPENVKNTAFYPKLVEYMKLNAEKTQATRDILNRLMGQSQNVPGPQPAAPWTRIGMSPQQVQNIYNVQAQQQQAQQDAFRQQMNMALLNNRLDQQQFGNVMDVAQMGRQAERDAATDAYRNQQASALEDYRNKTIDIDRQRLKQSGIKYPQAYPIGDGRMAIFDPNDKSVEVTDSLTGKSKTFSVPSSVWNAAAESAWGEIAAMPGMMEASEDGETMRLTKKGLTAYRDLRNKYVNRMMGVQPEQPEVDPSVIGMLMGGWNAPMQLPGAMGGAQQAQAPQGQPLQLPQSAYSNTEMTPDGTGFMFGVNPILGQPPAQQPIQQNVTPEIIATQGQLVNDNGKVKTYLYNGVYYDIEM